MKQLETEYKKQIELELPDLWSRIEAGVDEYEANKALNIDKLDNNEIADGTATVIDKKEADVNKKQKRKANIYVFGKYLAAAAVLFIVLNVFSMFGNRKEATNTAGAMYFNSTNDEAPAMEESTACAEDAEVVYEEADATSEEAVAVPGTTRDEAVKTPAKDMANGETDSKESVCEELDEAVELTDDIYNMEYLSTIIDIWNCNQEEALTIMQTLEEENIPSIVAYEPAEGDAATEAEGISAYKIICDNGDEYYVFVNEMHGYEVINIKIINK